MSSSFERFEGLVAISSHSEYDTLVNCHFWIIGVFGYNKLKNISKITYEFKPVAY